MNYLLPSMGLVTFLVVLVLPLVFYFAERKRIDQSRVTKQEINQILSGKRLR